MRTMKLPQLITAGALAAVLGLPLVACAQQAPPPSSGAPAQGGHRHGMGMQRFKDLNLTSQQQTQIKALMDQFRQAHPPGSQPDPQSRKQLHEQINALLTPTQQAQMKADREKMRDRRGAEGNPSGAPTPIPSQEP